MSRFNYVSLFSGIGGFEQALNSFGGECVFASEIDKFATQAYEALYGHRPAGDVTQVNAKDVPDHDLLVGGFPCQAFSLAGKRKGFEDTRGTLFFEIVRIAKEKQPKALLLENVKGLVNHDKGNTLEVMLKTLNDIGYVVDFDILNSKYFGVPQNRERIFIVAIREDLIEQEEWLEESTIGQTVIPRGKRRIQTYEWLKSFNFNFPTQENVSKRLVDILEQSVDERFYLGEDKTAKLTSELEDRERQEVLGALPMECEIHGEGIIQIGEANIKGHRAIRAVHSPEGQCPTLTTMGGGHREPKIAVVGNINDNDHNAENARSKDGLPPTITARDYKEPKLVAGDSAGGSCYRIRKLTPLECWRLQGFPDEAHDTVERAGLSNSQRYKQAGNAVTVSVIKAIAANLLPSVINK